MGKVLVHEFVTLDGVIESPTWTMEFGFDPKMGEAIGAVMGSCSGILLGRRTYEMFAPAWSPRTADEDPGAPFMNDSPKYVVTGGQPSVEWNNTHLIGAYDAGTIRNLKDEVSGDLYVSGSGMLVRGMLDDGLVDELHLMVYPLTLGQGDRLFVEGGGQTRFTLAGTEAYANGVLHLTYTP